MYQTADNFIKQESTSPEGIGVADDSGFASIGGSSDATSSKTDYVTTIAQDVRFNNNPLLSTQDQNVEKKRKRQLLTESEAEAKRLEEEKYNQQIREQRYKRLMHLLDRSQFYSSYLVQKIDGSLAKEKKKVGGKRKGQVLDENTPPQKKSKKSKKEKQEYDIREYVSKDMKKKLHTKKDLNLSHDEIEDELMSGPDTDVTPKMKEEDIKPKYFVGDLRDYQIDGLKWLKLLYENGVNGILADEMGLGKTIQVIALMCHLIEKRTEGPYLIIAPLSTIPNWLMEFEKFAPKIPVVLFYGKAEHRTTLYRNISKKVHNVDGYKTHPVVITTFETPLSETTFLRSQKWRYIVIDEGQRIKNPKCQLVQVLKKFESMNRLLLTGTPLQNNLSELWSLLNFLLPEIFNDLAVFESWFDANELQHDEGTKKILQQEEEKHVLCSLREILKPFMLRRIKSDVCLDIPGKKELVVYAPLTELQHELYRAVLDRDIHTLSKIEKSDLILPEVDGQRPKRKCRLKNKYSPEYMGEINDYYRDSNLANSSNFPDDDDDSLLGTWKKNTTLDEKNTNQLSVWKQFADVTDRNREYFIRIQFQNRAVMYKKIVNHPYLVHCPLNSVGLPRIDEELVKSSGKLLVLDAMLKKLKAQGHKVLLFSTMTMILDMIEDYLEMRDFSYVRLDGSRSMDDRTKNIKMFNTDPDMFLFLISTRAGGVGLNLAAADTVIIYDSDWNPQVDIQAMARCHRIGQTRPVVVYKFCTKGTIDERIIKRAEAKRKLEKMVISKDALKFNINDKDTLIQLKNLLDSSDCQMVKSANEVFTEEELDKLLDRSDLMPNSTSVVKQGSSKSARAGSSRNVK